MSAERDKVAVDWDAIPAYLVAHVATAIASARRLGAEEMRERCAEVVGRQNERHSPGLTDFDRGGLFATSLVLDNIRSLPLPPEVSA
jgi:hypothetical protein